MASANPIARMFRGTHGALANKDVCALADSPPTSRYRLVAVFPRDLHEPGLVPLEAASGARVLAPVHADDEAREEVRPCSRRDGVGEGGLEAGGVRLDEGDELRDGGDGRGGVRDEVAQGIDGCDGVRQRGRRLEVALVGSHDVKGRRGRRGRRHRRRGGGLQRGSHGWCRGGEEEGFGCSTCREEVARRPKPNASGECGPRKLTSDPMLPTTWFRGPAAA